MINYLIFCQQNLYCWDHTLKFNVLCYTFLNKRNNEHTDIHPLLYSCGQFLELSKLCSVNMKSFNFCGYIVGVYIYGVYEMFWYRHVMHNNHIMENGVSIPSSIYLLCYKQSNYTPLVILECTVKLSLTIIILLCYQVVGLIHSL